MGIPNISKKWFWTLLAPGKIKSCYIQIVYLVPVSRSRLLVTLWSLHYNNMILCFPLESAQHTLPLCIPLHKHDLRPSTSFISGCCVCVYNQALSKVTQSLTQWRGVVHTLTYYAKTFFAWVTTIMRHEIWFLPFRPVGNCTINSFYDFLLLLGPNSSPFV